MDPQGHRPTRRARLGGRSSSGRARDLGMVEVAELVEDRERRRLQRNGPEGAVNVTRKVHGLVGGTGNWPSSGTDGPTAVTRTRPRASSAETVSPWIASRGWAALATTTPPDRHLRLGQPARDLPVGPARRARSPTPGRDGARLSGDRQHAERGREQHGAGRPRAGPAGPARGGRGAPLRASASVVAVGSGLALRVVEHVPPERVQPGLGGVAEMPLAVEARAMPTRRRRCPPWCAASCSGCRKRC